MKNAELCPNWGHRVVTTHRNFRGYLDIGLCITQITVRSITLISA